MSAYNKSNVIKPEQEAMDEVNNMDISIEIKNLQLPKENEQLPKQEQMVNIVTDEDEFKSAKSKIIQSCNDSSIMMSSYNQIGDSFKKKFDSNLEDMSYTSQDTEIQDLYAKVKETLANEQYDQLNKLSNEITTLEMTLRKNRHEDKMAEINEIEEIMKKQTEDMIQSKKAKKLDEYYLINACQDEGYSFITQKDLNRNYESVQFKDYEFYIEKQK